MAVTVRIKRSSTSGVAPSSLADGEIALNQADGVLYGRNGASAVVALAGPRVTDRFSYASGNTLSLSREPIGSVAVFWSAPDPADSSKAASLVRVDPNRYSVSGKTLTLTNGLWGDLAAGDFIVVDYTGGKP